MFGLPCVVTVSYFSGSLDLRSSVFLRSSSWAVFFFRPARPTSAEQKLLEKGLTFVGILNKHHTTIKLKASLKKDKTEFLDTEVFFSDKSNGEKGLSTNACVSVVFFFKTTDTHALLHKKSFHLKHTFKGTIKLQLICFHRICTNPKDVEEDTGILFRSLRTRGYSRPFLRTIKSEVQLNYTNGNGQRMNPQRWFPKC